MRIGDVWLLVILLEMRFLLLQVCYFGVVRPLHRRTGYDLGIGIHSMCVRDGSRGNAQKNPSFCIVSNSFLESICNITQSFLPCPTSRQISDRGASRSLSKVCVILGNF